MAVPANEQKEGPRNLHIWRTGQSYTLQKGALYRKEWTNLYFSLLPQPADLDERIIRHYDVRKPLPLADNSFDGAYAMHVIEHLDPNEGLAFVKELYRVVKPRGICRLSTPDLEDIIRNYFSRLKIGWADPSDKNICNYRWAQFEIFDQLTRRKSGGEMIDAIKAGDYHEDYLKERYGDVYQEFIPQKEREISAQIRSQLAAEGGPARRKRTFLEKLKGKFSQKAYQYRLRKALREHNEDPRRTLESNKWMHDRLSVKFLMEQAGFMDYQVRTYKESDLKGWDRYRLDQSNFGDHAIEPSLYVEARKP